MKRVFMPKGAAKKRETPSITGTLTWKRTQIQSPLDPGFLELKFLGPRLRKSIFMGIDTFF
jgi:hypothetical protein